MEKGIPIIRLLTYVFSFFIPMIRMIESLETQDSDQQLVWLHYFVFYGVFSIFEIPFALFVPFWQEIKLPFILIMQIHNNAEYAVTISKKWIIPFLIRFQPMIKIIQTAKKMDVFLQEK